MSYPTLTDPDPVKFKCIKCDDHNGFWAVTPDNMYKEPSREYRGKTQSLITTSQCPLCGKMNTVYWYKSKIS
jgi:hypothetical protein